jgi:hypothetical protein
VVKGEFSEVESTKFKSLFSNNYFSEEGVPPPCPLFPQLTNGHNGTALFRGMLRGINDVNNAQSGHTATVNQPTAHGERVSARIMLGWQRASF